MQSFWNHVKWRQKSRLQNLERNELIKVKRNLNNVKIFVHEYSNWYILERKIKLQAHSGENIEIKRKYCQGPK